MVFGDCQINCLFTRDEFVLMSNARIYFSMIASSWYSLPCFFRRFNTLAGKLSVATLVTFVKKLKRF